MGPADQNLPKLKVSVLKYGLYFLFFSFFFAEKNVSSFCSKNINVFENTLTTTINEFAINELVKLTILWTTWPSWFISQFCWISPTSFIRFQPRYKAEY